MSLDFTKVTYVDGETVIGADNLNDMQDAILDLDDNKVEKEQGKGLSENDYTDTDKQKVDDAYVVPEGGIPKSALSDAVQTSLGKADTALQEDDLEDLTEDVSDLKSASELQTSLANTGGFICKIVNGNFTGSGSATPELTPATNRLRPDAFINCYPGTVLKIDPDGLEYVINIWDGRIGTAHNYRRLPSNTWGVGVNYYSATTDCVIIVILRKSDDSDINPADYDVKIEQIAANAPKIESANNLASKGFTPLSVFGNYRIAGTTIYSAQNRAGFPSIMKVYPGERYKIINNGYVHAVRIWTGDASPQTNIRNDSVWIDYDEEIGINESGFLYVTFANSADQTANIDISTFAGEVNRTIANQSCQLNFLTFNTGNFSSDAVTEADTIANYARLIGATSPAIMLTQEDTANVKTYGLPTTLIYDKLFKTSKRYGSTDYNYFTCASDYIISNSEYISYTTSGLNHRWFIHYTVIVDGTVIHLIDVHFDWQDKVLRKGQIDQVIAFCANLENVIIAGDFNPSNRINGEQVDPAIPEISDIDFGYFADAGYSLANKGAFGTFGTIYSNVEGVAKLYPFDQICVKGNIKIKDVRTVYSAWQNDHKPLAATLLITL